MLRTRRKTGSALRAGLMITLLAIPMLLAGVTAANGADLPAGVARQYLPPTGGNFGAAIAADGDTMVTSKWNDGTGVNQVFVYEKDATGAWTRVQTINGPSGTLFGMRLALSGDHLVVGDPGFVSYSGAFFLYVRDAAGVWQQRGGTSDQGEFGSAVDVEGDLVASTRLRDRSFNSGNGYFRLDRWTGSGLHNLVTETFHGGCVEVTIRFPWAACSERSVPAAVRIYRLADDHDSASLFQRISFGSSAHGYAMGVELTDGRLAVSAPNAYGSAGEVRVYDFENDAWQLASTTRGPSNYAYFGAGVAVEGDTLAVRSYENEGAGIGMLRFYHLGPGGAALVDSMPFPTFATFRMDPVFNGNLVHLGAPHATGAGPAGAYVFDFDTDADDLPRWDELVFGTDPADPDTDDDYWGDGTEFRCGASGVNALSFPLPGCTGGLPDHFTAGGGPGPNALSGVLATAHEPLADRDADADFVPDVTESRLCGTGALASAIATADGAAGECVGSADHELPDNPLRDPAGAYRGSTGEVDAVVRAQDVRELRGVGPDAVSAWEPICMVEDANTGDDGSCSGTGARSAYAPPLL